VENKDSRAIIALLVVQLFFGTLPVIGKTVLTVIPSLALVGFRVGIAAVALVVFQFARKRLWLEHRDDYIKLAVLSLFGVVLNQMLFIGGLSYTKASNTSLLAVTIPIFTLGVGWVAGTEKLYRLKVIGITLAAVGVLILIDPRRASFASDTTIGDVMIVLNSLSFGIYVATSKEIVTRNGAFRSMMWVFVFASLVCVPVGLFSLSSIDTATVPVSIWLRVLYISLFATAVPYLLNAWSLARVSPSTLAVFIYLQPIIGFLAAVWFLGERIDARFAAAAALVFAGLYLVLKRRRLAY
jgi:drug/metabolite transporter (DMT)-like permease